VDTAPLNVPKSSGFRLWYKPQGQTALPQFVASIQLEGGLYGAFCPGGINPVAITPVVTLAQATSHGNSAPVPHRPHTAIFHGTRPSFLQNLLTPFP